MLAHPTIVPWLVMPAWMCSPAAPPATKMGPPLSPLQVLGFSNSPYPAQKSPLLGGRSLLQGMPSRISLQTFLSIMGTEASSRTGEPSPGLLPDCHHGFVRPQPTMVAILPGARKLGWPAPAVSFWRGRFVAHSTSRRAISLISHRSSYSRCTNAALTRSASPLWNLTLLA